MNKIDKEQQMVAQMIKLYCHRKEGNQELCPECRELLTYALTRLDHCKFGEKKKSCKRCPVHCYRPDMKERIRRVMKWAAPRMFFRHPVEAIKHLL